ncbi:MAG: hypothetical protein RR893_05345, partial [Clostridia bacterium]
IFSITKMPAMPFAFPSSITRAPFIDMSKPLRVQVRRGFGMDPLRIFVSSTIGQRFVREALIKERA